MDERSYITKGGRVRLFGEDYQALRWAAYQRSRINKNHLPLCECGCGEFAFWTPVILQSRGDVAHNEHGARKSDELHRIKWLRRGCHSDSHNAGGKPVPKK